MLPYNISVKVGDDTALNSLIARIHCLDAGLLYLCFIQPQYVGGFQVAITASCCSQSSDAG